MIEFGKTLRAAREAKGLSVAQLAEQTHMTPARVEELESENFTSFPAAIYGRGFVRLYCQAVGLDPKPLADEFTEIFNGNRVVEIRERASVPAKEEVGGERSRWSEEGQLPLSASGAEPKADIPRSTSTFSTSDSEVGGVRSSPSMDVNIPRSTSDSNSTSESEVNTPRSTSTFSTSNSDPTPSTPHLSRYAAPVHDRPRVSIPPAVWRIGILACVAILVLWGLVAGVRALYRATGGTAETDEPESAPVVVTEPEAATPRAPEANALPSAANEARTPQDIPALYID